MWQRDGNIFYGNGNKNAQKNVKYINEYREKILDRYTNVYYM
jgi:hypothetical protein